MWKCEPLCILEEAPPREGRKYMLIVYVVALMFIVILLCSAVRLHFSCGLHHGMMTRVKVKVEVPHRGEHTHLHDHIFRQY